MSSKGSTPKKSTSSEDDALATWMGRRMKEQEDFSEMKLAKSKQEGEPSLNSETKLGTLPIMQSTSAQETSKKSFVVPGKRVDDGDDEQPCERRFRTSFSSNHNDGGSNSDWTEEDTMPGAFPVAGIGATNEEGSTIYTIEEERNESVGIPPPNIQAVAVDEAQLAAQYQNVARQAIRARIQAEAVEATEVQEATQQNASSWRQKLWIRFCLVGLLIVVAPAIIFVVTMSRSSSNDSYEKPTLVDMEEVDNTSPTDFEYVMEHLRQRSISSSNPNVFNNASTPQFKALDWLVHEDQIMSNIEDIPIETLIDRYVLAVLYFATNGSNWERNDGYLTQLGACDWFGIICDVTESITEIQEEYNNLEGTIPAELAAITSLETVALAGNKLQGTIPAEFGNLSLLEWLQLSINNLTGTIPNSLTQLVDLERIFLADNQLTGTISSGIAKLPEVQILSLHSNLFSGTVPEFDDQDSFLFISVRDNLLDGPIPESVLRLKNLERLLLSSNQLSGTIPTSIGGTMTRLEHLWMEQNVLTGTIPSTIGELEFLETFSVAGNDLNGTIPTELGHLLELEHLYLYQNRLTGTIPSEVGLLNRLQFFSIVDNPITGTLPFSLVALSNLEIIDLAFTAISGDLDSIFCNMTESSTVTIVADCDDPLVTCTCCTTCCNADGCTINVPARCESRANDIERTELLDQAIGCSCIGNYSTVSCDVESCTTCNDAETICGRTTKFDLALDTAGYPQTFFGTFEYTTGPFVPSTISWEFIVPTLECKVILNDQDCSTCTIGICDDGFRSTFIDCTNTINSSNSNTTFTLPPTYTTCFPPEPSTQVLDIFGWIDTGSYIGCPIYLPIEYFFGI